MTVASGRRPGYAPSHAGVGHRGKLTRDRIVGCAANLFVTGGFHGTSMDTIARAVGASRATIYQYFQSKDEIFLDLVRECEPEVLAHGERLGRLGPDAAGVGNLHRWLIEWEQLYDKYAVVFLEFPGIGTIELLPRSDAGAVPEKYAELISSKLRDAGVSGIAPADAAAALLRISHMVNLYRFRGMFKLSDATATTAALTIAMQLLLFPEAPDAAMVPPSRELGDRAEPTASDRIGPAPRSTPLHANGILAAAATLFGEHGYYSVSMDDVAEAAGLSRATLYRNFNTKVKILSALTELAASDGGRLAAQLTGLAPGGDPLQAWMAQYVQFHRTYGGVIRAWYDGTVAQQLTKDAITSGMGRFHAAAQAYLGQFDLPPHLDRNVAVTVFLAVLGRMTEISASRHDDDDEATARLMLVVVQRALLGGGT